MADLLQQFELETEERQASARPRAQPLNPFQEAEAAIQQTVSLRAIVVECVCGNVQQALIIYVLHVQVPLKIKMLFSKCFLA